MFVIVGGPADPELGRHDEYSVRLRLDSKAAQDAVATESTDKEALFLPNPVALIRSMEQSQRLIFRFTPFHTNPTELLFDLSGLSGVVGPLKEACGWDSATVARKQAAAEQKQAADLRKAVAEDKRAIADAIQQLQGVRPERQGRARRMAPRDVPCGQTRLQTQTEGFVPFAAPVLGA